MPERYLAFLRLLQVRVATLGYDGIQLYSESEVAAAQVGYSVSPEGTSYCTGEPGDWKSAWLVIGHTISTGEPIILDTSMDSLPVFTDCHGQGAWEPLQIADSLEGFAQAFRLLAELGHGREHPVALAANPLPAELRNRVLSSIFESSPNADIAFWAMLLPAND